MSAHRAPGRAPARRSTALHGAYRRRSRRVHRSRRGRDASRSGQWDERSNQLARWLVDRGVEKQDRVALYMDSDHCLQWIVAYAAIHKAGAVVVPVNTRLSIDEVLTILRHAEPSVVITNERLLENARTVAAEIPIRAVLATTEWHELDGFDADDMQVPRRRRRHRRHHVHVGHHRTPQGRARSPPQRRDDPEHRADTGRTSAGCTARRCSRSRA